MKMDAAAIDALEVIVDDQTRLGMAILLVVMMFTVALALRFEDFRAVKAEPYRVLGGVLAQLVGLPLLTLILIFLIGPPASIALGMLIVASCPGGNVSNLLTHFARGNTAYSVSLTTISSVSAALTTPISILLWSSLYTPTAELVTRLDVDPLPFISQTIVLLALPLAAGMFVATRFPRSAAAMRRVLAPISLGSIAVLVIVGAAQNWDVILTAGSVVIPIVVIHNAAAFALGSLSGRAMRMEAARRRSLAFEVGIQNSGLGLLLLLSQFDGVGGAAAIIGMWSIWHLIGGSALAGLFRGLDWLKLRRKEVPAGE